MVDHRRTISVAALLSGPVLSLILWVTTPPVDVEYHAWVVICLGAWMVIWWLSEAVPLAVTAILPIFVLPMTGVADLFTVGRSYTDPLILLFLGGFLLAEAMQTSGLTSLIATRALQRNSLSPARAIGQMMVVTAVCSLFVSNTATTMMMVPVAVAVSHLFDRPDRDDDSRRAFTSCLMLAVAYGATIGGIGSLIGTPPNAIFAAYMREAYDIEVSFGLWMSIGLPIVCVLLPLCWCLLTRVLYDVDFPPISRAQIDQGFALGVNKLTSAQRLVLTVFAAVALAWVVRPLAGLVYPEMPLTDAGIALFGALVLFILPVNQADGDFDTRMGNRSGSTILNIRSLSRIKWSVLVLFGGGLALAHAMMSTGVASWITQVIVDLDFSSVWLLVAVLVVLVVFLGELASNTAMAAIVLPVAGAVASTTTAGPWAVVFPVAVAATIGFMLPVATPPNAIVYGSGKVTAREMMRAGFLLDVVGIGVVLSLSGALLLWFR